jgi:hypothetical protein
MYRDELEKRHFDLYQSNELIETMTPVFQRENTKWSRDMQVSFCENVIGGFRSTIMLYHIASEDSGYCYILDGLQRLTALCEFVNDQIPVFGELYSDIAENVGLHRATITLNIFEFDSHEAACLHYISINENISHSPEDLEVAYQFINSKDSNE